MRCAGEYGFPYLYNICRDWILHQIDVNLTSKKEMEKWALRYLQAALRPEYENVDILEALWYEIDVNTVSVIRTANDILTSIDRKTVAEVLKRDTLTIPGEKVLHDFAVRCGTISSSDFPP
ncbi:hypothetical protein RvY_12579-3 [Ramazzottius varieornatus]|uniref:Uncharacterized protein n=1 Tax=Ramazzottius varieornatus TaxID=947166 RepID=A0A1D1VTQ3_RAMVA|nr:hypothetical protein RvY_12579-3 [Ramazzottius varieornatus]